MDKETLDFMFNEITQDIKQAILDLEKILLITSNQQKIDSFEETYCKNCKQPCGRSNAEILNCVMNKRDIKTNIDERPKDKRYAKEYLEEDLKKIIQDLKKKYDEMKSISEKTEKKQLKKMREKKK